MNKNFQVSISPSQTLLNAAFAWDPALIEMALAQGADVNFRGLPNGYDGPVTEMTALHALFDTKALKHFDQNYLTHGIFKERHEALLQLLSVENIDVNAVEITKDTRRLLSGLAEFVGIEDPGPIEFVNGSTVLHKALREIASLEKTVLSESNQAAYERGVVPHLKTSLATLLSDKRVDVNLCETSQANGEELTCPDTFKIFSVMSDTLPPVWLTKMLIANPRITIEDEMLQNIGNNANLPKDYLDAVNGARNDRKRALSEEQQNPHTSRITRRYRMGPPSDGLAR